MSDVILVLQFNQFDALGNLFLQDIKGNQERQFLSMVLPNTCGQLVRQAALQFSQKEIVLVGDSREFLEGLQEIILSEYTNNYDNNIIDITILT